MKPPEVRRVLDLYIRFCPVSEHYPGAATRFELRKKRFLVKCLEVSPGVEVLAPGGAFLEGACCEK